MVKPTIYIHHSSYNDASPHLPLVEKQHKAERYPLSKHGFYTFYQYFIEKDGTLVHTRPDKDPSVVYKDVHKNSISICLAGNFDLILQSSQQEKALGQLLERLRIKYNINALDIKEHRNYQNTSCPGRLIPRNYFAYLYITTQLGMLKALLYTIVLKLKSGLK